MKSYDYQRELRITWQWAVTQYEKGNRDSETYFNETERSFLDSIGLTPNEVYDFAEDYVKFGEPDFTTFALIHDIRRSFFLDVQGGRASEITADPASLPARDAEAAGVPWLPRIIEKAKSKLRGELDSDVMYACPNDRRFLKEHDIHPAEFLRKVWESGNDRKSLIDWVVRRSDKRREHEA